MDTRVLEEFFAEGFFVGKFFALEGSSSKNCKPENSSVGKLSGE
jgi:hypothetical protein